MIGEIFHTDNLRKLKRYPDNSFDAVVTDAPYGLSRKAPIIETVLRDWLRKGYHIPAAKTGICNKTWDAFVPQPKFWKEVYRVLKPGGHILCFFATRTYDLGTMAMRLAGFEVRDCLLWVYGQGFPKSLNIYKASGEMKRFKGLGTALKPAYEPIALIRKPLQGNVLDNAIKWGTGGLNIDATRIPFQSIDDFNSAKWSIGTDMAGGNFIGSKKPSGIENIEANVLGRFPANFILDSATADMLDLQSGILRTGAQKPVKRKNRQGWQTALPEQSNYECAENTGGASRFFYIAKPSPEEKNAGIIKNSCPTVKPISLMQYLVRMITPKGGTLLDPFAGSGTTGCACELEQHKYVLLDNDPIAYKESIGRCRHWHIVQKERSGQLNMFQNVSL